MDPPSDNLPKGFIPISDTHQQKNQVVNVVGVVVHYLPPKLSRGTDYTISFTICDGVPFEASSGLSIRVFRGGKDQLPQIKSIGDIVMIWDLKISVFNNQLVGISNYATKWTVACVSQFTTHQLNLEPSTPKLTVSSAEMDAINSLYKYYTSKVDAETRNAIQTSIQQTVTSARKFAYIRDMQFDSFYDMMGEVVKVFSAGQLNFTIYLTDYTHNPLLHCYGWGDSSGAISRYGGNADGEDYTGVGGGGGGRSNWVGPCGQYTLQITLWDIHAEKARKHVREGHYIRLKNVRAKQNGDGKLEGVLHGDRKYPSRVDVEVVDNPEKDSGVKALKVRKREVERRAENERVAYLQKLDTAQRKEEIKIQEQKKFEESLNPHIRKTANDIPLLHIGKIKNVKYPNGTIFTNTTYRTVCRVIDYQPIDIKDFSVLRQKKDRSKQTGSNRALVEEDPDDEDSNEDDDEEVWEWRFTLLVEGQDKETLILMVNNENAQFLLNMDASNLSEEPDELATLRKRLSYLWGNLEEQKLQTRQRQLDKANPALARKEKKRMQQKKKRQKQANSKRHKGEGTSSSERNNNSAVEDDDSEDGSDENEDGFRELTSEFYDGFIKEYGQRKVINGEEKWIRRFALSGVKITPPTEEEDFVV